MRSYRFYIVKGNLICEEEIEHDVRIFVGHEALLRLSLAANIDYADIDIDKRDLYMQTDLLETAIYNYVDVLNELRYKDAKMLYDAIDRKKLFGKLRANIKYISFAGFLSIVLLTGSCKLYSDFAKSLSVNEEKDDADLEYDFPDGIEIIDVPIDKGEFTPVEEEDEIFIPAIPKDNIYNIDVECFDRGDSDDVLYVMSEYGEIVNLLANRYGVSPELVYAMITQESHGLNDNLMQVIFSVNKDEPIRLYNFDDMKYDYIVLTNNKASYPEDYICISETDLHNSYYNILAGISIFLDCCHNYSSGNLISALGAYNHGATSWNNYVIDCAAKDKGVSRDDILLNPEDLSYIKYDDEFETGDTRYIEHVLQYLPSSSIYVKSVDDDGNILNNYYNINRSVKFVKK